VPILPIPLTASCGYRVATQARLRRWVLQTVISSSVHVPWLEALHAWG